jgi:hypothetical protein
MLKQNSKVCALTSLMCGIVVLTTAYPVLAESVGPGCAQPTKVNPIRRPDNQNVSRDRFKTQAGFIKGLSPDAVFVSFAVMTYGESQKYVDGAVCDISLNRMVAVAVVDYPKGIPFGRVSYSKASSTGVFDAVTGIGIASATSGDMIGGGPLFSIRPKNPILPIKRTYPSYGFIQKFAVLAETTGCLGMADRVYPFKYNRNSAALTKDLKTCQTRVSTPISKADQAAGAAALVKLETEFAPEITELQVPPSLPLVRPTTLEKQEFSKSTKVSEPTVIFTDGKPIDDRPGTSSVVEMPPKPLPNWVASALKTVDQVAACGFYTAPRSSVSRYEVAAFVMTCRERRSSTKASPTADSQKLFRDFTQEFADEIKGLEPLT